MGKIVAIGGGEIGRPGYPVETLEIDKEIIRLSGKEIPKFLFIPTASSDSSGYVEAVKEHFGGRLGCCVDELLLIGGELKKQEIADKIMNSDIIYVGGGNTQLMMEVWRELGVDKILAEAYDRGIVMSGLSAGSICWFESGMSDSIKKFSDPAADYVKVSGLGFIKALNCPHYDIEEEREPALFRMMNKNPGIAIALENCAALEVVDGRYRIISSNEDAKAYKIFWSKGYCFKEEIGREKKFRVLGNLLSGENKSKQIINI